MKRFFSNRSAGFCITFGAVMAALSVAMYTGFTAHTNTLEFCISCHEMEENVYQEYKNSLHYNNRVGVRAECPDCHVPKVFPQSVISKIAASKDVFFHLMGTIDTKEKFEANRLEMAKRVWSSMEKSASRECRSCHSFESMVLEEQGRRGRKKHPKGIEEGKTCIDCHKGVVHKLPKDYKES